MAKYFLLLLILPTFLTGCVQIRLLTYPSDIVWLDTSDVESVMQQMAVSLGRLDTMITSLNETDSTSTHNENILSELAQLEKLANTLNMGTTINRDNESVEIASNHPLIDEHINQFINQVSRARLQLELDSQSYYAVGQLSGSCNACHRLR